MPPAPKALSLQDFWLCFLDFCFHTSVMLEDVMEKELERAPCARTAD